MLLILQTNLLSHTLDIPYSTIVIIAFSVIFSSVFIILYKINKLKKDIVNGYKKIVSSNTEKNIKALTRLGWMPLIPLFCALFIKEGNLLFISICIAIIILLVIKFYYFDNIISFSTQGYNSGFDQVIIKENLKIKEVKRYKNIFNEDYILFELYEEKKLKGFDKFFEEDYVYLKSIIK